MKKTPLFVAFTNQKGGVGKSAITVLMASYFHYVKGLDVLVVDCDFPQHSIYAMRERDKQTVMQHDYYKQLLMAQVERTGKKAWHIVTSKPGEANRTALQYLESSGEQVDLVLIDLPGSVDSAGVFDTIFTSDYVFIPITADRMVMQSSLTFAGTLRDFLAANTDLPLKGIYMLWNKIDNRVSKEVFNFYLSVIGRMKLDVLKTILPESQRFNRELSTAGGRPFFRCTLHPPLPKFLKDSNIDLLAEEISTLLDL